MEYTSYIETGRGPDQLDLLERRIKVAGAGGKEVYILAIPRGEYDASELKELCFDVEEVHSALNVNGTIDIVVAGDYKKAEDIGREIFTHTGQEVGCVKYSGESMSPFYLLIKKAIRAAKDRLSPVHTYDPSKDSTSAKIKELKDILEKSRSD